MAYFHFGNKTIRDGNAEIISSYNEGYVFGRNEKKHMNRIRSLRIALDNFIYSSENRRVLRKYHHKLVLNSIPYPEYTWKIHKMGKDFYDTKFGKDTFSANKIKELFTSPESVNFTHILTFKEDASQQDLPAGFCIAYSNHDQNSSVTFMHYAFPFYSLDYLNTGFGMYMMTKTVEYCKNEDFDYLYLGSMHDPSSLYKLQFKGLEWFDEEAGEWSQDLGELKARVKRQ